MRRTYSFLILALLGLAVFAGCNSAEKKKISNAGPAAPRQPTSTTDPADSVRRITVVELRDLLAKNEAVVIDVRNDASYKAGHIRGARLIPLADTLSHLDELPKDKLIVTYCS
jgi:predicted sulfurtransferase